MAVALEATRAGVVASFVLAGGVLTGKYDIGEHGRAEAQLEEPGMAAAREHGARLRALADELGSTLAALAIAFALANPTVATVLFGARTPEQLADNARALELDPGRGAADRLIALSAR